MQQLRRQLRRCRGAAPLLRTNPTVSRPKPSAPAGTSYRCFSSANADTVSGTGQFLFSDDNNRRPKLPPGSELKVIGVPVTKLSADPSVANKQLEGYGKLVEDPSHFTADGPSSGSEGAPQRTFEIVKWPVQGWRQLDPGTGDEAGTTEGQFKVQWSGDLYLAENLAINTTNNRYLDGLGTRYPERATEEGGGVGAEDAESFHGDALFLWMSDYHPDGGQLFFPFGKAEPCPFFVCLGKSSYGDDIKPDQMAAFRVPAGRGIYIHPGTWHNGIYVHKRQGPRTFFTRQGRVHARIGCSWAQEFNTLLRLRLEEE